MDDGVERVHKVRDTSEAAAKPRQSWHLFREA